ncbi:MAG TPA: glycosyltransferase family 39 protein [Steroidobacteraceae bacterium]|nr:glycosyltransferase family 39 protein [Steroidobacteraceae bacterium]
MTATPRPSASVRSSVLLIVVVLAPLWLIGILDRGLWTPDEPREADIAWRMSWQSDRTLPELAGSPFLEKPPLSYWLSGGAVALFGDSAAAARAPNLLYAVVASLATFALAFAMLGETTAAVIAALIAASALTAWRVTVWLAPDACLLAASALALLGAWLGYRAPPGRAKALGYALMHAGAAAGFMAKSAPGWLVPGLALLAVILWERRFGELRRWELYAGLALQAAIIGPWIAQVALGAGGPDALRTLFWNNLVGRFMHIAVPVALDYTAGHRNRFGKYFLELPLYLLPWTLIVAAALARAWRHARTAAPAGTPWRFALAASLPLLALLSLAATARDVYAAPALLGFALLAGLWAAAAQRAPGRLDHLALRATRWLVALLVALLVLALAVFAICGAGLCALAAIAALPACAVALGLAARAQRRGDFGRSLIFTYGAWAAAVCCAALAIFPVVDRWQNLPALAARIRADTAYEHLALLDPDETTIAMLDHGFQTPLAVLTTGGQRPADTVSEWFRAHGRQARILILLPGHAGGKLTRVLGRLHRLPAPDDGVAGGLAASGAAVLVGRYELPQGRRYALMGPPPPS